MKKNRKKEEFLEQLRKIPIVLVACEKSNISRNSVYRWRAEDNEFSKEMDAALVEGETLVNDLSENQLLSLIKDKNWPALSFWLRHRHPKYKEKVEITGQLVHERREITVEEKSLIEGALRLAMPSDQISNEHGRK